MLQEHTMIQGICHWFYRMNRNDQNLRYCRHGSLCRYKHLTQEEVMALEQHGAEDQPCPRCHGQKVQPVKWVVRDVETQTQIMCMTCNGRGQISVRERILQKVSNRLWCHCKHPSSSTRYFPDNTHPKCKKHCYVCTRCNGISQTG